MPVKAAGSPKEIWIVDEEGKVKRLNVECDGEEWHNSAVAHQDQARDEFLRACGIDVLRFRGPEIWDDAQGCAEECALVLKRWWWLRWSGGVGKAVVKAA
jgi:very-short-patch-repair endonuclease